MRRRDCRVLLLPLALVACNDDAAPAPLDLSAAADLSASLDASPPGDGPRPDLATPGDLARPADAVMATPDLLGADLRGTFSALGGKYASWQDCMPSVAPDPVFAWLEIQFENGTAQQVGPIHFYGGRILDAMTGRTLLTYDLKQQPDIVLQPRQGALLRLEKALGTGKPANGCKTVDCNTDIQIVIDWGPPGGAPDHATVSEKNRIQCLF